MSDEFNNLPIAQTAEHDWPPYLVPPNRRRSQGTNSKTSKRAHQQMSVWHVRILRVEEAEQEQAHGGGEPGDERHEANGLPPRRVVDESVEQRGVPHVMHGEHGPEEAGARQRGADDEYRLERMRGDVAYERHVGVNLLIVAGAAEREPPQQQNGEGEKPKGSG